MEGVLLVIKAWGLAALMLWVHRRFFERVARADPEFEAWCARGPLIAALCARPQRMEPLEAALRLRLGRQRRLIATLGGYPWPNYELEIRLSRAGGVLRLAVARAELRKAHAPLAPGLVLVLRELLNEHPGAIEDLWLLPDVVYGLDGPSAAPAGWTVLGGQEARPRVRARETIALWLFPPQSISERKAAQESRAAVGPRESAVDPKLLGFSRAMLKAWQRATNLVRVHRPLQ